MRELKSMEDIQLVAKAFDSDLRMKIIDILKEKKRMNLNDLSGSLGVTNGALTSHIRLLHKAGVINIESDSGKRGSQKICFLKENKYLIDLSHEVSEQNSYEVEVPVGTFCNYSVCPTCGIAMKTKLIGEVDNPRYFDDPQRSNAGIVWFARGFLEYRIPNYLKWGQKPSAIQISLELSSEAPGVCDEWPSDINFYINGHSLGTWTSPGDYGNVRGLYTPDWFPKMWNQYGLLKLLTVNRTGTYIDGVKIADITVDEIGVDYKSDIVFRIAVLNDGQHAGGLTIFGKSFGNYYQDICIRIVYTQEENKVG